MSTTRTLIHVPASARRGDAIEIRATIGHPMETGHRSDSEGRLVPRNILTRFECRLDGVQVCAVDLHPAVAANPYLAFPLRVDKSGTLEFIWEGDHGFRHRESIALNVAAA